MKKRFWKGLRAIDLVVILSFISIIVGIVVVRYPDFRCRSMQSEAKFSLQEIYAAQWLYHEENDQFASIGKLVDEDHRVSLPKKYYTFIDKTPPTKDSFLVLAKGVDGSLVAGELWTINESKDIKIINQVCKN